MIIRIANEMVLRDNSVTIIVDRASGELLTLVDPKVKIFPLKKISTIRKVFIISRILRTQHFDRFYTTLNKPNLIGFLSSCIAGRRKKHYGRVAAVHSMSLTNTKNYKRKLLLHLLSLSYRWFGNIICVSEAVSLDLIQKYNVPATKIEKIYNPTKPNKNLKSKISGKAHKTIYSILVVGRLVRQKNVDKIIKAFHQFQQIHNKVELNILGDGPELENFSCYLNSMVWLIK